MGSETYVPGRQVYAYASDAIYNIEDHNCSKGCQNAINSTPAEPGGSCPVLYNVLLEVKQESLQIDEHGNIHCSERRPL